MLPLFLILWYFFESWIYIYLWNVYRPTSDLLAHCGLTCVVIFCATICTDKEVSSGVVNAGIEPGISSFVSQCLNQLCHRSPTTNVSCSLYMAVTVDEHVATIYATLVSFSLFSWTTDFIAHFFFLKENRAKWLILFCAFNFMSIVAQNSLGTQCQHEVKWQHCRVTWHSMSRVSLTSTYPLKL